MDSSKRNDVATLLRSAGVDNAERLAALAEPSWRLTATRSSAEALSAGESRLGGAPDVPDDFEWPSRDGAPLSFLAQIDLAEVSSLDLPPTGWLLFFYEADEQPWGFEPQDAGGARVIYVDGPRSALRRRDEHGVEGRLFEACSIRLQSAIDLPDLWDSVLAQAGLEVDDDQQEAYLEVQNELAGRPRRPLDVDDLYHHVLGNPQLVQNDMRRECEAVTKGFKWSDPDIHQSVVVQSLLAEAPARWRLLLQLDTDEAGPSWIWGDTGRIYFWIRRDDLAGRVFERVWLVLQCG